MDFSVQHDVREVERYLTSLQRKQVPFATALAQTWTAKDVQEEEVALLRTRLDRPRKFTLRAVRISPATKRNPIARVWIRDEATKGTAPIKYLAPLIYGGPRNPKRHEKALQRAGILPRGWYTVPGKGARLNRFGNITSGTYTRILSDLRASSDPLQNRTRENSRYFVIRRNGRPIGIYERRGRRIKAILHFVPRAPRYRRILPFHRVAEMEAQRRFIPNFHAALERALRTAR